MSTAYQLKQLVVRDSTTGLPVPGAEVRVYMMFGVGKGALTSGAFDINGDPIDQVSAPATTDFDGVALIRHIPGTYYVEATYGAVTRGWPGAHWGMASSHDAGTETNEALLAPNPTGNGGKFLALSVDTEETMWADLVEVGDVAPVNENVLWFDTVDDPDPLGPEVGGTGVANDPAATTTRVGAFAFTITLTGVTSLTFPTSGTLATLAGAETLTNKTLAEPIINKAVVGDDASVTFRTAGSGRAQLGLLGNDDFTLQVSPDGSTWHLAFTVDVDTGEATFDGPVDIGYSTLTGWKSLTIHHSATHGGGYLVQRDGGSPFTGLSGFDNGTTQRALYLGGGGWGAIDANQISMYTAPAYGSGVDGGVRRLTITAAGDVVVGTNLAEITISSTRHFHLRSYTVAALPTPGTGGRLAYASNCRMFDGTGTQEGAGSGTGGVVVDNGTAWKISGTNVTAVA